MELIAGKLNNRWLEGLLRRSKEATESVRAAIAYANGDPELFEYCFENKVKLTFWCRYDSSVPVSTNILEQFLYRKSPNYICRLVADIFHPKVIWWEGFGAKPKLKLIYPV